jgi:hypothetical protein
MITVKRSGWTVRYDCLYSVRHMGSSDSGQPDTTSHVRLPSRT